MNDTTDWRAGLDVWPRAVPDFTIDLDAAALVVVDMQRLFLDPAIGMCADFERRFPGPAAAYFQRVRTQVVPHCARLISWFRELGRPVIYTTVGPETADLGHYLVPRLRSAHTDEGIRGSQAMFPSGSWEHGIIDELSPRGDELVLNKITSSVFTSTGIDLMLRNLRATDLVFVGVATDSCVALSARDAADRGYRCTIVEDACATFDPRTHADALRTFARVAGVVTTTADLTVGR